MVKKEIKEFKLLLGSTESVLCRIPFSVHSALMGKNLPEPLSEVCFAASIFADAHELSSKYIFLKITEPSNPFTVSVNGRPAGEYDGIRGEFSCDIAPYLSAGENIIQLSFTPSPSAGIFGKAELIRTDSAIIDRISLIQKHEGGTAALAIKLEMLGACENVRAVATLVSGAGQIYYGGLTKGRGTITVRDPLYWWPRGLGIQNLYKLTVNLYGDSEVEDTKELRVGLRAIVTANNADGSPLEANGAQFVPMGAVYVHDENPDPTVRQRKCEAVVTSAARASFNTLVVPRGTPTLPECFYELCDAHGIVVIHEISEIDIQTREMLLRSTVHPSVGLLDIIGATDRIAEISEQIRKINPELEFALFERAPEYPSVPTLPCDKTAKMFIPHVEDNPFSETVESVTGDKLIAILNEAAKTHLYARDLSTLSYVSRLVAAEEIREQLAEARILRNRRAVFSYIGGDGYISPSSLDSQARWKALQYYAARFFTQTLLYAKADGAQVSFYISNERRMDFSGEVEYRILDRKNRLIYKATESCRVPESSSSKIFLRDLSEYVVGHEREYYLEYLLREGSSIISRATLLFVPPKRFAFLDPGIKAEIVGDDRRFSITLTAESFAKDVEIDFTDTDALFLDSCLDLTSSAPVKIAFTVLGKSVSARYLTETLKIKSIYDIK